MNTSAEIVLQFADSGAGGYLFKLAGKQIEELQRACGNAALGLIHARLLSGQFDYRDVVHTIRLGLIGGGMAPTEAGRIVDAYVDGRILAREDDPGSPLRTAQAVISAVMFGLDELDGADEGKPKAGTTTDT